MKAKPQKKQAVLTAIAVVLTAALLLALLWRTNTEKQNTRAESTTYIMSTVMEQKAYGAAAEKAMAAVEQALRNFENELSLFISESDIAAINAAAGMQPVTVKPQTLALLTQAKELSLQKSDGAFALTIAPLTLAWGVTTDTPRVLSQSECDALLPLVDDSAIMLDAAAGTVMLQKAGQAVDLGGIAKGTACNVARDIYKKYKVDSALLSIGGNIYAHGAKPDGSLYRIGFRDPKKSATASIASITLKDEVFAVSGGYERFFEQDGVRYHHILDPKTGAPAHSDIVSVGVIDADGTVADFYSTTLFVWGKARALEYLKNGGKGMLLDEENNLYVSQSLKETFELVESGYHVIFV
ncbi:MAG: FAD:protein FMN transferase [Ruthenibacterium sp.]